VRLVDEAHGQAVFAEAPELPGEAATVSLQFDDAFAELSRLPRVAVGEPVEPRANADAGFLVAQAAEPIAEEIRSIERDHGRRSGYRKQRTVSPAILPTAWNRLGRVPEESLPRRLPGLRWRWCC
jgi:hypothetical protein